MAGPSDVLTTIQNGVTALNNLGQQVTGSFNNIAGQLSSGVVTSIAGNKGAFTLNGPSGITNTVNDILLSQASTSQFGAVKVNGTTITASAGVISLATTPTITSLSSDVLLSNTATYFDGPSIAQGSSGTWYASGAVVVTDTAGAANISVQLWDGTNVLASGHVFLSVANAATTVALSGFRASPAGNLRISCKDNTSSNGKILFDKSGGGKDATITVIRIA
jgi:hypothetical protein